MDEGTVGTGWLLKFRQRKRVPMGEGRAVGGPSVFYLEEKVTGGSQISKCVVCVGEKGRVAGYVVLSTRVPTLTL